jgi:hypothetical protein
MTPTTESDTIKWPLCSVMLDQMAHHFQWNYLNVKEKKESKKRWVRRDGCYDGNIEGTGKQ